MNKLLKNLLAFALVISLLSGNVLAYAPAVRQNAEHVNTDASAPSELSVSEGGLISADEELMAGEENTYSFVTADPAQEAMTAAGAAEWLQETEQGTTALAAEEQSADESGGSFEGVDIPGSDLTGESSQDQENDSFAQDPAVPGETFEEDAEADGQYGTGSEADETAEQYDAGYAADEAADQYDTGYVADEAAEQYDTGSVADEAADQYNTEAAADEAADQYDTGAAGDEAADQYDTGAAGDEAAEQYDTGSAADEAAEQYDTGSVADEAGDQSDTEYTENSGEDTSGQELPGEEVAAEGSQSGETEAQEESSLNVTAAAAAAESAEPAEETTEKILTWEQYRDQYAPDYESLSKEEIVALYADYEAYRAQARMTAEGEYPEGASSGSISNDYLDVSVGSDGRFSIGNIEGNPNYSSDNGRKLLYGYPDTGTSSTLLYIDGDEMVFTADSISYRNNVALATMLLDSYGIAVTQKLSFVSSGTEIGGSTIDDCVKIEYKVTNTGTESHRVGIRIMIDTMLASNDDAPFKVKGTGNVTTIKNYDASTGIPDSYQVYDSLTNPTTIATGYLVSNGEIPPDRVQFTNWREISNNYWSYVGYEGGYLGDSAVGIYWDPASLSSGKSKTVSTYYGVGVGASIDSSSNTSSKIGNKEIGIEVKDSQSGEGVKDASITMTGLTGGTTSGTTDSNGFARLPLNSQASTQVSISVKAAGYTDGSFTRFVKGGDRISVSIKREDDDQPAVTSVTLDGQDVMNGTVHYIDNSGKDIDHAKDSDIKKIKLIVKSDTADCIYYLLQDNAVVEKNTTGEFELKTVETKSGTVIDKFSSGGIRKVYCVSKDGKTSRKIRLGIKVSIPSVATTTIADLNLWPYSSKNLATGTLGALLLGDSVSFGLKNSAKLKVEIKENGKVKVSYNLNRMPNTEESYRIQEAKREFATTDAAKVNAKKVFGGLLEKGDRTASLGIPKHIEFDYGGYGEGIVKNGKVDVSLAIMGTASVSASYTVNYYWVVPLYITVSGKGSITVQISGDAHLTTDDGRLGMRLNGSFNPSLSVGIEGGVGSKGVANLGVEGRGTLSYTFTLPAVHHLATLTGEANLKMGLWKFEKSLSLAKATVKLLDSEDWNGSPGDEGENLYEALAEQPFKLKSRDYMNNEHPVGLPEDADVFITNRNVSADAEPLFLNASGKKFKFWIDENMDRSVANGSDLMYSVNEDGWWSDPLPVDDDGTADFSVNAAYDGSGKVFVVWENSSKVFDDNTVTVDEMGNAQEICIKVFDTASNTFGETVSLTNNNVVDAIPAVAAADGTAYVVWNRIDGSIESGDTQSSLCSLSYQNGTASAESVRNIGTIDVAELSASIQNGKPTAVYTVFNLSEGLDAKQTTYTFAFEGGSQENEELLSGDGSVVRGALNSSLNGSDALFWYQDGNICYRLSGSTEIGNVFTDYTTDISEYTVADLGDTTYVIWKGNDVGEAYEEELPDNSAVLYAAHYRNGVWSKPYELLNCECDYIHGIHAESQDGQLVLTYVAINYDEEGNISSSEMIERSFYGRNDAVLTGFVYDADQAFGSEALPLSLTVANNGTGLLDQVTVEISGWGDTYSRDISGLGLDPGESTEISIDDFIVDESVGDGTVVDYDVCVYAEDDDNYDNGRERMVLGYADIIAEQLETTVNDGRLYYPVSIKNYSRIPAVNVNVKFLADSEDGSIIYDTTLESLDGGESQIIYIPETDLEGSAQFYVYLSSDTPLNNEGLEYTRMTCSGETIRVLSDINVSITAGEGGSIEAGESGTYTSNDAISLTASPADGYVFDRWESDFGFFEDENSESTIFYVPEKDSAVTAVFVRADEITGLQLDQSALTLKVGDSAKLNTTADQAVANSLFDWSTDNAEVAKVNTRGKVTGVSKGTTVITAALKSNPEISTSCEVQVVEPEITSIRMVYPRVKMTSVGEQKHLKVDMVTSPSNLEDIVSLTWESQNTAVVEVDNDGVITAKAPGTAIVSVRPAEQQNDDVSAQCEVTVSLAIEDITLTDADGNSVFSVTVRGGEGIVINAAPVPEDTVLSEDFKWSVSDEDLISIETEGENKRTARIKGLQGGSAIVTVSHGDVEKSFRVNVEIPAQAIALSSTNLSIRLGDSSNLSATVTPENTTDELTWESADSSIASIYNGEVYGNSPGKTTITAKAGNISKSCKVTVYTVPATGVTLSETSVTITKGDSHYLSASVTPSDTTDNVSWSSSNTEVASVYDGDVYANKVGTATITASAGKYKKTCKVTVKQKQYETKTVTSTKGFESDYTDAATHYYSSNVDKVWKLSTASYVRGVRLKFDSRTEFENSYDYLEVLDKDGEPVALNVNGQTGVTRLTGTMLQGQTITVTSLPVRIHMHTDGSVSKFGFKVSSIKYLYNIGKSSVSLAKTSCPYTGSAIKPAVTVKAGNTTLKNGTDYTVTYKSNKAIGTATVVVAGKSPNNGKKTLTFNIVPKAISGLKQTATKTTSLKLTWTKQSGISGYKVYKYASSKYTQLKQTTANSYTVNSLKAGTAYSYAVAAYKKVGSKTLVGPKKLLKVYTAPVMNKPAVTAGSKKAVLKWKKVTNATGYEIYTSNSKSSGFKKAATITKGSTLTSTIKNLTSKKKKYFKMRAYIKTASGNVYSSYSAVVSCTIK
ncbi:Ig-like domain (group 2) [Sarcina sp. DSM 11001]|uniref:Ig-like domain-containing protein n=1 Tax=Sarcina sp. DSM 11001 TaxID=1798184 RepID=UPI000880EFDF|nr:Ig-like domain-containing protein [Sarcina sp. DSM 11001]SDK63031.1 Ig-like domain (group 2) [Sarcina sp. DSM 11001]